MSSLDSELNVTTTRPYLKDLTISCIDGKVHCHRIDLVRSSAYFKNKFQLEHDSGNQLPDKICEPVSMEMMQFVINLTNPCPKDCYEMLKSLKLDMKIVEVMKRYQIDRFVDLVRYHIREDGNTGIVISNLKYWCDNNPGVIEELCGYLTRVLSLHGSTSSHHAKIVLDHLSKAWEQKCVTVVNSLLHLICSRCSRQGCAMETLLDHTFKYGTIPVPSQLRFHMHVIEQVDDYDHLHSCIKNGLEAYLKQGFGITYGKNEMGNTINVKVEVEKTMPFTETMLAKCSCFI
jgi:hypothetical protein